MFASLNYFRQFFLPLNKITLPAHNLVSKTNVAFFALLMMVIGFFSSRIVLSIGMMLFGVAGLWGVHPKRWLAERWWLLAVAWVAAYGISGIWSEDSSVWWERFQVKFPFLLLPLAVAFIGPFSSKQIRWLTGVLNACVLAGISYSLWFFFRDAAAYIEGYSFSHVLPTIPKNDHIRFSIFTALTIAWNVYSFRHWQGKGVKLLIGLLSIIFSIYLHILAARTGLLALYIFLFGWLIWLIVRKQTRTIGIGLLVGVSLSAYLAFSYMPTLQRRLNYIIYTVETYQAKGLEANFSDMGRIISFQIAGKLIAASPLIGVGAGDMMTEMKNGYQKWNPDVKEENMLIPHNQYLIVALGCGIPAALIFLIWIFYPIFSLKHNRSGYFLAVAWFMMLVPLLVEPMFEVQFGVFVYLFFLLLFYHQHRQEVLSAHNKNK